MSDVRKGSVHLPRTVFVVGATASGKTDLGVRLAQEFGGEIINADARQIYRQVSIGTGKPKGVSGLYRRRHRAFLHHGIPHYLMDFLPPNEVYSAPQWRESAMKAVRGISKRGHLPIVVGGTGLYISGMVDNLQFPDVEAHKTLREAYEAKSVEELWELLLRLDPDAASAVDSKNKRRVIRAIEIITFTGKKLSEVRAKGEPIVDAFQVGISRTSEELFLRARKAIETMIENGLVDEVRHLLAEGVSPNSPAFSALGYREVVEHLHGHLTIEEVIEHLNKITKAYIRRQRTWFKRDPRIVWVQDEEEGVKKVGEWLGMK